MLFGEINDCPAGKRNLVRKRVALVGQYRGVKSDMTQNEFLTIPRVDIRMKLIESDLYNVDGEGIFDKLEI